MGAGPGRLFAGLLRSKLSIRTGLQQGHRLSRGSACRHATVSAPHALRSPHCVVRDLIGNFSGVQMRSQIQKLLNFHPRCSSRAPSGGHTLCSRPDEKSAGAGRGEIRASPGPGVARVQPVQRGGKEPWSGAIQADPAASGHPCGKRIGMKPHGGGGAGRFVFRAQGCG
jgi:hypothetical protein